MFKETMKANKVIKCKDLNWLHNDKISRKQIKNILIKDFLICKSETFQLFKDKEYVMAIARLQIVLMHNQKKKRKDRRRNDLRKKN